MEFAYTADRQKLKMEYLVLSTGNRETVYTHYYLAGGLEIRNDDIEALNHADGRIVKTVVPFEPAAFSYQYRIADHLGNTRVLFDGGDHSTAPTAAGILQENHYYSFGLEQLGSWNDGAGNVAHRYRFNGIERNEELGLDLAFFRTYDPAIGRWMQIDPRAEKYVGMSPYNGMGNNPIYYSDQLGDTLSPTGTTAALSSMYNVIMNGSGGHYESQVDSDGHLQLTATGIEGSMTDRQQALVNTIQSAIDAGGDIKIEVVDHSDASSSGVAVGDSGSSPASANPGRHVIDVGDMQAVGTTGLVSAQSMLAHEVAEGEAMQVDGVSAARAHTVSARAAESRVTGYGIGMTTATTGAFGRITGFTVPVTRGFGTIQNVQISIVGGQVTGATNNRR